MEPVILLILTWAVRFQKVVNNHEGSYLLTQPKLVEEILTKWLRKALSP